MRVIAIDTETYPIGLMPEYGKPKVSRNSVPRMVCMTSHDGKRTELLRGGKAIDQFVYWLRSENTHLTAHNLTFDVTVLIRAAWEFQNRNILPEVFQAYEDGRMHCTVIRQQLLDIARTSMDKKVYTLEFLSKYKLGIDISESKRGQDVWRKRYNELDPWPTRDWPEAATEYAKFDAVLHYKLFMHQQTPRYACTGAQISGPPGVENEHLQTMGDFAFGLMSAYGMTVDIDWVRATDQKYSDIQDELREQLTSIGALRPLSEGGSMSMKVVQGIYANAFAEVGEKPLMTKPSDKFPEGQISTSKDARNKLEDLGVEDPRFQLLALWSKLSTFRSTYIEPMVYAHPYCVSTRFKLVNSGRISASRPNLTNLPKRDIDKDPFKASDIRRCYVPREGHVYIDADYSTLEMRTLAQVCLNMGFNSQMAEALIRGRDLHTDVAAQMCGITYEEAGAILENKAHPRYTEVKKKRALAKVLNFGLPGGLGAKGFVGYARGFGHKLDYMKAANLREFWLSRWTEMPMYFDHVSGLELPSGLYGVHQHGPGGNTGSWRVRACTPGASGSAYTAACNTYFQGMAADGAKFAAWLIAKACYVEKDSPLFGFRPNIFVHDQFILEGPETKASAAAHELVRLMEKGMSVMVPDIPTPVEAALSRRWDVDAVSQIDDNGEMSVYETPQTHQAAA